MSQGQVDNLTPRSGGAGAEQRQGVVLLGEGFP
jgi:hypothetical protein